ncbi:response regulator transcription factor [Saccharibacillus sacchari]|uniref:response regulator transcription factor n=1 Tax=Saccharibacillus sacchari TaxID=456493 RepID=UPI0004AEA29D|nr:response regulator transcription factor [Saccharibacillus sacchari]
MFHILIAEDDRNANKLMSAVLRNEGYTVTCAFDGREALEKLESHQFDLIVADVMMPHIDGYELTRMLREAQYRLPILMVTAKELPEDKHKGFLVGTDDYMTKPVDKKEMLLRIQALLRRSQIVNERRIAIGGVTLNYDALNVSRGDEVQALPPKEFYLLYKLLAYPGQVFTRIQLLDEIWGLETESAENTITVHINRLRKRFEAYSEFEIQAVRGLGYRAVKNA